MEDLERQYKIIETKGKENERLWDGKEKNRL